MIVNYYYEELGSSRLTNGPSYPHFSPYFWVLTKFWLWRPQFADFFNQSVDVVLKMVVGPVQLKRATQVTYDNFQRNQQPSYLPNVA